MKPVCAEEKKAPSNNSIAGYTNIYQWKIQCKMPPKTKKILPPENIQ